MSTTEQAAPTPQDQKERIDLAVQKRTALGFLSGAWDAACAEGVEPEILAHAALFMALCDMIATYGEGPVADLAETLPERIRACEFTVDERTVQ